MKGLPQLTVLLLILLLPSQALCMACSVDRCTMQADPEPVEIAESAGCHQMADHQAAAQTTVTSVSLESDCCALTAEPDDKAPAVLAPAPANPLLAAVPTILDSSSDAENAPVPQSSAPPTPNPPLYHLHSSLLI